MCGLMLSENVTPPALDQPPGGVALRDRLGR